ncbi:head-tail connector protein [Sinorhizobium medicae]
MEIVTLDDMKSHLGITDAASDSLIAGKIDAAQAHLETLLGYVITEEFTTVPDDLKDAVRQLAASWFENREAVTVGISAMETPLSFWDIVRERRSYAFE